jgi:hypothetical protein
MMTHYWQLKEANLSDNNEYRLFLIRDIICRVTELICMMTSIVFFSELSQIIRTIQPDSKDPIGFSIISQYV